MNLSFIWQFSPRGKANLIEYLIVLIIEKYDTLSNGRRDLSIARLQFSLGRLRLKIPNGLIITRVSLSHRLSMSGSSDRRDRNVAHDKVN